MWGDPSRSGLCDGSRRRAASRCPQANVTTNATRSTEHAAPLAIAPLGTRSGGHDGELFPLGRHQAQAAATGRQGAAAVEQDLALGQLIYDLRTEAGLSQPELAQRMGTAQSVISRLEEGGDADNNESNPSGV